MKRIAIVAPCILPVPATKGGAVEGLITRLIDDNEQDKCFEIDLYTLEDNEIISNYLLTTIISIRDNNRIHCINRVIDKYYRVVRNKSAKRPIDHIVLELFIQRML